jgi:hypothetical protein
MDPKRAERKMAKNKSQPMTNQIFRMSPKVILETFEEGALVLRLDDRHVIELNPTAAKILKETNGRRSVNRIAAALAKTCKIPKAEARQDSMTLYQQLTTKRIVELVTTSR